MSPATTAVLFATMLLLAALPGASALAVAGRAAASGFAHGAATTAGIVAGDLVFIALALGGLSALVQAAGPWLALVDWIAAGYLLWLALRLLRAGGAGADDVAGPTRASLLSDGLAGLLITLGDQKAVLFYLAFLPAFVDLATVSLVDAAIVAACAALAIAGAKLVYALAGARARAYRATRAAGILRRLAAVVMLATALWLVLRA